MNAESLLTVPPKEREAAEAAYELGKDFARLIDGQEEINALCRDVGKMLSEFWKALPEEAMTKAFKALAKKEEENAKAIYETIKEAEKLPDAARVKFDNDVEDLTTLRMLRYRELLETALPTA